MKLQTVTSGCSSATAPAQNLKVRELGIGGHIRRDQEQLVTSGAPLLLEGEVPLAPRAFVAPRPESQERFRPGQAVAALDFKPRSPQATLAYACSLGFVFSSRSRHGNSRRRRLSQRDHIEKRTGSGFTSLQPVVESGNIEYAMGFVQPFDALNDLGLKGMTISIELLPKAAKLAAGASGKP